MVGYDIYIKQFKNFLTQLSEIIFQRAMIGLDQENWFCSVCLFVWMDAFQEEEKWVHIPSLRILPQRYLTNNPTSWAWSILTPHNSYKSIPLMRRTKQVENWYNRSVFTPTTLTPGPTRTLMGQAHLRFLYNRLALIKCYLLDIDMALFSFLLLWEV